LFVSIPNKIFVPIPSVPETKRGSLYPHCFKSNIPPKPPIESTLPFRAVDLLKEEISFTSASVLGHQHLRLYMLS